jgi:thiamine biosynthesis protein ThiI
VDTISSGTAQPQQAKFGAVDVVICRYGEVHLKGQNRGFFLRQLERNIRTALKGADVTVTMKDARIIITGVDGANGPRLRADIAVEKLRHVFGITGISIGQQISYKCPDDILAFIAKLEIDGGFKVEVNRADKKFPIKSNVFAPMCGDIILKNNPAAKVNVRTPKIVVSADIRAGGIAFIFSNTVRGPGGLPVGVSGRALCLISGGIDSPVAAYLAMKRGLTADFIHFASPPYTGENALRKVETLCKTVHEYSGAAGGRLFVVPFTKIQQEIREHCKEKFTITLMRRFMVAIAEKVGLANRHDCIITGENLAQVASQTVQGITTNNFSAKQLPILRPLICFDKEEIINIAKQIGTYETSILPYPDCCTVFVPAHPSIKPKIEEVLREEAKLNFDKLAEVTYSGICEKSLHTCGT